MKTQHAMNPASQAFADADGVEIIVDKAGAFSHKLATTPAPVARSNSFTYAPHDTGKSYATEARLVKAIADYGFSQIRHMIFQRADGRWVAIFTGHEANPVIFRGFTWFM